MSALCPPRLRRPFCIAEGDVRVVLRPEVIGHLHLAGDVNPSSFRGWAVPPRPTVPAAFVVGFGGQQPARQPVSRSAPPTSNSSGSPDDQARQSDRWPWPPRARDLAVPCPLADSPEVLRPTTDRSTSSAQGQRGRPMLPVLLDQLRVPRLGPGRPRTRPDALLADTAYSSRGHRALLDARGVTAVIPERADPQGHRHRRGSAGGRPVSYDRARYQDHNVIERSYEQLKQWRGLATRYDKLAVIFRGGAILRSIVPWLRSLVADTRQHPRRRGSQAGRSRKRPVRERVAHPGANSCALRARSERTPTFRAGPLGRMAGGL